MTVSTRHAFTLTVDLLPPTEVGQVQGGFRRIVPIVGGTVDGPDLQGEILPGGADWNLEGSDGTFTVWARYDIKLADGTIIGVVNGGTGVTPPEEEFGKGDQAPALPTQPKFEVPEGGPEWLKETRFFGLLRESSLTQVRIEIHRWDLDGTWAPAL
jgi:hypothetical protein